MANSNSNAAENALRKLLLNMRNGTKTNHTQALAKFKAAVRAYNKAQVNAVKPVTKALGKPTVQNGNGVKQALTRLEGLRAQAAAAAEAAAAEAKKVPIGKNNSKVTRNNTGKKQGLLGRVGGAVRGVGGALGGLVRPRSRPGKPNNGTTPLLGP